MDTASSVDKRKKAIRKFSLWFLALVLFLVFFSKTIDGFLQPSVSYTYPVGGNLEKDIQALGEVKQADTVKIFAGDPWKVKEVKVKEGQQIKKGELLMVVDVKDALLGLQTKELECRQLEQELTSLQKKVEECKSLVEAGAESSKTLEDAVDSLQSKQTDLEMKKIELNAQKDKIPEKGEIRASEAGTVQSVQAEEGSVLNSGEVMLVLSKQNKKLHVEWKLDEKKAELLKPGSDVKIKVEVPTELEAGGFVTEKEFLPKESVFRFEAEVDVKGVSLQEGQQVRIEYTWRSRNYPVVIPNSSVIQDGPGHCVYVLKTRSGALGEENYVEKVSVNVLDSDDRNSAVDGALPEKSKVVFLSSKVLENGMQVKKKTDS